MVRTVEGTPGHGAQPRKGAGCGLGEPTLSGRVVAAISGSSCDLRKEES